MREFSIELCRFGPVLGVIRSGSFRSDIVCSLLRCANSERRDRKENRGVRTRHPEHQGVSDGLDLFGVVVAEHSPHGRVEVGGRSGGGLVAADLRHRGEADHVGEQEGMCVGDFHVLWRHTRTLPCSIKS